VIVTRRQKDFGFVDQLLSLVKVFQPAPTPSCPAPPPLTFTQTPPGLMTIAGGSALVGFLLGAVFFKK
jgi:hypothetical protein